MLIVPNHLEPEISWLEARLAEQFGAHYVVEHYALHIAIEMAMEDHWQKQVFGYCAGAPWLQGVPEDARTAQLAALAACFEQRHGDTVLPLQRPQARYPLVVPAHTAPRVRAVAANIGRTPEAALCALLAITITQLRFALQCLDHAPYAETFPAEIARLAR